jgi:hypothetical protein
MSVTVCIDRLLLSTSSSEIHRLTEQFGTVRHARIVTGPAGDSLRFGYVETDTAEAAKALTSHLNAERSNLNVTVKVM